MKAEGQQPSSETSCTHHLGYLNQRPKGEEMPGECLTCEKLIQCMASTTSQSIERPKPTQQATFTSVKREKPSMDLKPQVAENTEEQVEKAETSIAEKETREIVRADDAAQQRFTVEDLDMLYASWTQTVRIDKRILTEWGKKTKEVEIETAKGKKARCKVQPIQDSRGETVQVPDKIQLFLGIEKGELVTVRPVAKK